MSFEDCEFTQLSFNGKTINKYYSFVFDKFIPIQVILLLSL